MARFENFLFTGLLWALICTSQIYASELKDNQQPPPTLDSENRAVENTRSQVQDSGVTAASPQTDHTPTAAIAGRLGNTFDAVAKSLAGVANGVGRNVEGTAGGLRRFLKATAGGLATSVTGTVGGLGKSVKGTVGGLGQSVDETTKGLGRFMEDSGEVILEVAEVAAKVAFVAGVVFLYIAAESSVYHYGNGYHHHNHGW